MAYQDTEYKVASEKNIVQKADFKFFVTSAIN